jgi:hypothetical protein
MATAKTAPVSVSVGDRVQVITHNGKLGTVRFVGETQFASGVWVGVELDVPGLLHCRAHVLISNMNQFI